MLASVVDQCFDWLRGTIDLVSVYLNFGLLALVLLLQQLENPVLINDWANRRLTNQSFY